MKEYLQYIKTTKSANTYNTYKHALQSYSDHKFTVNGLLNYIDEQRGLGKSESTIKSRLVIIGNYLRYSHKGNDGITRIIAGFKTVDKVQPCPTPADIAAILDSIDDDKYRAIFFLGCECGLRVSEIVGIRMVDYDGLKVILRNTKNHTDAMVTLTENAKTYVDKYIAGRKILTSTLFTGRTGTLSVSAVQNQMKKYMDYAGCGWCHMHTLRRYFANALLGANVNIATVQQAMRHKSISSTIRYLNISNKQVADAVRGVFG